MKKHLTLSNLFTLLFVIFIAAMLISPNFKATVLRGLMQIGLFQPSVNKPEPDASFNKVTSTTFVSADGRETDLLDLNGKVVFINFWATWCPPCIAEMPMIQKLHDQFKHNDKYVFMMVDMDANLPKSVKFMEEKGYHLPVYLPHSAISKSLYRGSLPTTVVIDTHGNIRFYSTGANDFTNKKFTEFMRNLGS